eukprot:1150435-Pelagomonas_calceolata.AAC.4
MRAANHISGACWAKCSWRKPNRKQKETMKSLDALRASDEKAYERHQDMISINYYRTTFRSSRKNDVFEGCGMSAGRPENNYFRGCGKVWESENKFIRKF